VKLKKSVKNWLRRELSSKYADCVIVTKSGDGREHQSYGIPSDAVGSFKDWAKSEMARMGIVVSLL
jgi:hypothetical protein